MIVYAESSAVLAWLLGEDIQQRVIAELSRADHVVTSSLTRVECARGLARARQAGRISAAEERAAMGQLDDALGGWHEIGLDAEVLDRATRSFPREPVRTLDALHLASALLLSGDGVAVTMLSLDERVRENAGALGFRVSPGATR